MEDSLQIGDLTFELPNPFLPRKKKKKKAFAEKGRCRDKTSIQSKERNQGVNAEMHLASSLFPDAQGGLWASCLIFQSLLGLCLAA